MNSKDAAVYKILAEEGLYKPPQSSIDKFAELYYKAGQTEEDLFLDDVETLFTEAPLPADWDERVFSDPVSKIGGRKVTDRFQAQLDYALKRAKVVGRPGTGRVAFEIEYQGRPTVLKIAKNAKGLSQNRSEARPEIYRKYKDIVVPLIDYDMRNEAPHWVHFEKAKGFKTDLDWKTNFPGIHINTFAHFVSELARDRVPKFGSMLKFYKEKYAQYLKFAQRVARLTKEFDISSGDLATVENWGVYKDRIVLLDLGMDSASAELY